MNIQKNVFAIAIAISIFMNSCQIVTGKCSIEKESIHCLGSTWKQDLLPIENDSLQKLNISKCIQSGEHQGTFDISFIKNLPKLKLLIITFCGLKDPPYIQESINSVEVINLGNNLIDESSQFHALGMNFFKRLPKLRVLNLSKNQLKDLPKVWFDCPNQLEILNLNDNMIGGLDPSFASCFTNLKQLYLRNNNFLYLKKLKDVDISFKGIPIRPVELDNSDNLIKNPNQLPFNVRHKVSKSSNEQNSYNNIIPQFSNLEILDLSFNKIQSLDQIPLLGLQNLVKLSLRGNRLMSYVKPATLERNCDFGTAPFYIKSPTGLIHLDLSENIALTRILSCWIFGLQNIQILEISNCSINTIGDSTFHKMKNISRLDLSYNNLNEVPKELVSIASTLRDLNLAHNNISQMRSGNLIRLINLRALNLSHNSFQSLLTFSSGDSDGKYPESLMNFLPSNDGSELDEPIGLFSRMRNLRDLDISYNKLTKISFGSDLPPSIKMNGVLKRINLNGNSRLTQLIDVNIDEITPTLTSFTISNDSRLDCNCQLIGFIKWIIYRNIKVFANCRTPKYLAGKSIKSQSMLGSILRRKNCSETTRSKLNNVMYRLKLFSNANRTVDSLLDGDPMNNNVKMPSSNSITPNDQQKWVLIGSNLTFRCEFYSIHQKFFKPIIEWQRIRVTPLETNQFTNEHSQQNAYPNLKNENSDQFDSSGIETLNSYYDMKIKTLQIGPFDEKLNLDNFEPSSSAEKELNSTKELTGKPYKFVSYLTLQPVYSSDSGRYRCIVNDLPFDQYSGKSHVISKEEEIKIYIPPKFITYPSSYMSIIEGETAEITCRAVGYPTPITSLGRIGSKDFPAVNGRRIVIYKDDSSFFISKVHQIDAGNYSCKSRNAAGSISYSFTLKVQIPASFIESPSSPMIIEFGKPLIIKHRINGVPSPSVKWFKDGHRVVENDRIGFSADRLMLIIQSTNLDDAGLYNISILNALGGSEASVIVKIVDNGNYKMSLSTPSTGGSGTSKELNWMSDYWLSAIIIIVVLSILLTSILWITIFLCFGKLIGSKKRRLLLVSNSQSKSSFDKCLATTTTNFSNPRLLPSNMCHLPMSLTTSTLVRHDQSREEFNDNTESDIVSDSLKTCSEFYSPQISRNGFPEIQSSYAINNHIFHSQPFLPNSKLDLSNCLNNLSNKPYYKNLLKNEPCDSGIDSSHIYSETLNSSDISSIYKCRHKSKHKPNNIKRKRHQNINNNSNHNNLSNEPLKSTPEVLEVVTISENANKDRDAQGSNKDYLLKQSKLKKVCNPLNNNYSAPLIDPNFTVQFGR